MRFSLYWLQIAGVAVSLFMATPAVLAADRPPTFEEQQALSKKYWLARPVYLDIRPITADPDVLTREQIADMAERSLYNLGAESLVMHSTVLPDRVRVLRIMYIIHQQPTTDGTVIAVSAKVDLLRTAANQYNTVLATSIYSGLQQTLVQGDSAENAQALTRESFERTLNQRIKQAFTNSAAR